MPLAPVCEFSSSGVKSESRFEQTFMTVAAAVLLVGAVLWAAHSPLAEKTDFALTYLGAHMIHTGDAVKLYDRAEQEKVKASLFKDANPTVYEHPPFEAFLFAPLAALPYRTAYLVWGLANAVIWLCMPFLIRPYAPVPHDPLAYFALWWIFAPLGVALYQGQSSLLILLLYALTFIALKRGHHLPAGVLLGLGLFKFQFVVPFAVLFFLRRKWRFLAGFSMSGVMFAALSIIAVGWTGILAYIRLLLVAAQSSGKVSLGAASDMATLDSFAHALLDGQLSAALIRVIVTVASMSLIAFTAWQWGVRDGDHSDRRWDLMFAAAMVVSLVTGMHMFTHDLSPLILAMLLVIAHLPRQASAPRIILASAVALFWVPPFYFVLIAGHCLYLLFPLLMVFAIATMMLASRRDEPVFAFSRVAAR